MANLTNRLLKRAARLAFEHSAVQSDLTRAFNARYGCTYSDVDCDEIIDILDYHGGAITVEQCDDAMERCGFPPKTE